VCTARWDGRPACLPLTGSLNVSNRSEVVVRRKYSSAADHQTEVNNRSAQAHPLPLRPHSVLSVFRALGRRCAHRTQFFCTFDLGGCIEAILLHFRQIHTSPLHSLDTAAIRTSLERTQFSHLFSSLNGARRSRNTLFHGACCRPHGRNKHSWS